MTEIPRFAREGLSLVVVPRGFSLSRLAETVRAELPEHQLSVVLHGSAASASALMPWTDDVTIIPKDGVADEHVAAATATLELATRRDRSGSMVVLLIDSLTTLARTFNELPLPGPTRSWGSGIDSRRLEPLMQLLRGQLPIVATVKVDNGSRMDEVVRELMSGIAARVIDWSAAF